MRITIIALLSLIFVASAQADPFTCVDSDGGDNLYLAGRSYYIFTDTGQDTGLPGLSDHCIIVPGFPNPAYEVPYCLGSTCFLSEANCFEDNPQATTYRCPFGCNKGACLGVLPQPHTLKPQILDPDGLHYP